MHALNECKNWYRLLSASFKNHFKQAEIVAWWGDLSRLTYIALSEHLSKGGLAANIQGGWGNTLL